MTARDLRARARETLAGNWLLSIGVAAVAYLLGGLLIGDNFIPQITYTVKEEVSSFPEALNRISTFAGSFGNFTFSLSALGILQFIIGGVLQLGYCRYLLNRHDRTDASFSDLFSQFNRFGQGFAQKFLRGLYSFLWGLLLIVPGIVKSYAYAMTPYIMAENPNMTASEALSASQEMMKGHKGELFWLDLTFIGWDFLANFSLSINNVTIRFAVGNLALNPYKNAARTAFYRNLQTQSSICTPSYELLE